MIGIFIAKCNSDDFRVTLASSKESVLRTPILYFTEASSFTSYGEAITAANEMKLGDDMEIHYLGYIDMSGHDNHNGGDIFN